MGSRLLLVVVLAVVASIAIDVTAPAAAHAKDTEAQRKKRARAFMEEGQAKYDLGKYDEAIKLYEQAYEIWPYPEVLYNLCQAHRQKKSFERAVFYCKAYLRNDPSTPKYDEVEKRIAEMEEALAQQQQAAEQPPKDVILPEGGGGGAGGGDGGKDVASGGGGAVAPPEDGGGALIGGGPAVVPRDEAGTDWIGIGLVIVGGAAVVGGLGLEYTAVSLRDDADNSTDADETRRLYAKADDRELTAVLVGGVGLAAVIGGVVKLAWPADKKAPARGVSLSPLPRGGFTVMLDGSF